MKRTIIVLLMMIMLFTLVSFQAPPRHDIVELEVMDKTVITYSRLMCVRINYCIPVRRQAYHILTPYEEFTTERYIYNRVQPGNSYTFYVQNTGGLRHLLGIYGRW